MKHTGQGDEMTTTLKLNFTQARAQLMKVGDDLMKAGANLHVQYARQDCPVSDNNAPGHVHTRDTIKVIRGEDGNLEVVAGGAAIYIEFGHHTRSGSYVPAYPFFLPAFFRAAQDMQNLKPPLI